MDYMPGKRFMDCFEDLTYEQKQRTASDMVEVIHALYSITATHCGSLQDDLSPRSSKRATRYGGFPSPPPTIASVTSTGQFVVGPAIELSFMEFPDARTAPTEQYGPYASERQYLEGLAFIGFSRTPAVLSKLMRWPFEKALEIYDRIQPAYSRESAHISADPCDSLFHFCHGDLSISNILLDPATGGITAILDWEVAGFRPAWAAAQAGGWFCDDAQRFVMSDNQDAPEGYDEETEEDHELRSYFRGMVEQRSAALLYHLDRGVELRAIRYILSEESGMDVVGWMEKYEKYEWDVALRGPFPFDREAWTLEWVRLYNRYVSVRFLSILPTFFADYMQQERYNVFHARVIHVLRSESYYQCLYIFISRHRERALVLHAAPIVGVSSLGICTIGALCGEIATVFTSRVNGRRYKMPV